MSASPAPARPARRQKAGNALRPDLIQVRCVLGDLLTIPSVGGTFRFAALFRLARLSRLARISRLMRGSARAELIKDVVDGRGCIPELEAFAVDGGSLGGPAGIGDGHLP